MCVVLSSKVIISNAFYAIFGSRNTAMSTLDYTTIEYYKTILYKMISKVCGYVMFSSNESAYIEIYNHYFIKNLDGVVCTDDLDESFINKVNSIYSSDIQEIIKKSYTRIVKEVTENEKKRKKTTKTL